MTFLSFTCDCVACGKPAAYTVPVLLRSEDRPPDTAPCTPQGIPVCGVPCSTRSLDKLRVATVSAQFKAAIQGVCSPEVIQGGMVYRLTKDGPGPSLLCGGFKRAGICDSARIGAPSSKPAPVKPPDPAPAAPVKPPAPATGGPLVLSGDDLAPPPDPAPDTAPFPVKLIRVQRDRTVQIVPTVDTPRAIAVADKINRMSPLDPVRDLLLAVAENVCEVSTTTTDIHRYAWVGGRWIFSDTTTTTTTDDPRIVPAPAPDTGKPAPDTGKAAGKAAGKPAGK